MQTNITLSEKESTTALKSENYIRKELQPQRATLEKILQFASVCKTEKITDTWIIDVYLN